MIDLRCSFFVVRSGNLSRKSKRACAPKTESVPVPVRSSRRAPWSRTSRRRSWYWRMLVYLHSSLRSRRLPRPNHEDWREFWPDDTLSTVPRAVAIFLAGTALGVLVAFLFLRGSRSETSADRGHFFKSRRRKRRRDCSRRSWSRCNRREVAG